MLNPHFAPAVAKAVTPTSTNPKYGQGIHTIGPDEAVLHDADALLETLRATFQAPDYQPPMLPAVAMELLEVTVRPEVDASDVLELLERDPMLTGQILRIAGSAYYAGACRVSSLRGAIVRLGGRSLTEIFFQVSVRVRVFRAPGRDTLMNDILEHSTTVGYICRALCKQIGLCQENAFLCGLLHDVGMAAALIVVTDVEQCLDSRIDKDRVWDTLHALHGEGGDAVIQAWGLPRPVEHAVRYHEMKLPDAPPIAAAVFLADQIAVHVEQGVPGEELKPSAVSRACEVVDLKPRELEGLITKFARVYAR